MSASSPRLLHVANGHSTTRTIEEAGIPGPTSIWADVLHDGPVPGGVSDAELLDIRARHLAADGEASLAEVTAGLQSWREAIARVAAYDELVLWYEHDLFDQLNLIQLLTYVRATVAGVRPVTLICIASFPGRPRFKGLGELTAVELGSLLHTRQPVTPEQYDLASRAWQAFRASEPGPLEQLLHTDTSALPYLLPALQRHLEEFPWTVDGLSRSERRLMSLASRGPIDVWSIWPLMHDLETAFYISDGSYWSLIETLASATPPLVALRDVVRIDGQLPRASIALTTEGLSVLAGHIDRVQVCGVDRWLGGVHLSGSGPLWRWDEGQARTVRA